MEQDNALNTAQAEQVVKTAVPYSEEEQTRAYHKKSKWRIICVVSLMAACVELLLSYQGGYVTTGMIVSVGLGAIFTIYFCFLVKEKLPVYYDENRICVYTDGLFEMNIPGLAFNNNNWGKILKAVRIWAVTLILAYPVTGYIESLILTGLWLDITDLILALSLCPGGLFIPVYIVGKKYE